MAINKEAYLSIKSELDAKQVTLVAVSKTKPVEDIRELYEMGHRDFGENYVQELVDKAGQLPKDIRWHFIGHLQRNKVKLIVPFVHLIHGVDSYRLLDEIDNESRKINRITNCLLQVHIAIEETKFGFTEEELKLLLATIPKYMQLNKLRNVNVQGLMGMASFTDNMDKVQAEFRRLNEIYKRSLISFAGLTTLSMGMSSDYKVALEQGSSMVRIGSLLFGERERKNS
jgi:PLP dependent protein